MRETFEMGIDKMEELYLPNFKTFIYFDRPDKDERVNFYDERKELLDCFYKNDNDLKELLCYIQGIRDGVDLFSLFCDSFDYGNSIKEILIMELEVESNGGFDDCINEIKKDIENIKNLTFDEKELLDKYDINKIGNWYFKGEW